MKNVVTSLEEYEKFKLNLEALEDIAKNVMQECQLPEAPLVLFSEGTNIVFSYNNQKVIKIFPSFHENQFKNDSLVLKHLEGKLSVKTPIIECQGKMLGWFYIVMTQLEGTLLETLWENMDINNQLVIMQELGVLIREVHALPTNGLEEIDSDWKYFIKNQMNNCVETHRATGFPEILLQQIPAYLESSQVVLPKIDKPVLLTGEYTPMNFLVKQVEGVWHIHGLIDFGDAMLGLPEYDLLGPGAFLIQGNQQLLCTFLMSYGYFADDLTEKLSQQLMTLMLLHQYSNLNIQIRIEDWQNKVSTLKELENLVWGFPPDLNDCIELEDYDPNWLNLAEEEISRIKKKCDFDWFLDIQHFGSTAILGIKSKPVIDIMVGVSDLLKSKELVPVLESMGYIFWNKNPKKDRLFFVKGMPPFGEKRTHHVHVFQVDHDEWSARQAFRDYLNTHEREKMAYFHLKIELMNQFKYDREAYTAGKSEFVRAILKIINNHSKSIK